MEQVESQIQQKQIENQQNNNNIQEEISIQTDQEMRNLIWNNKIPVKLTLSQDDIVIEDEIPHTLYIFMNMVHLPGIHFSQIHQHFEKYCPAPLNEKDIWLEWNKNVINWYTPFGVTFDLIVDEDLKQKITQNQEFLPLEITVHYRNYPNDIIKFNKQESINQQIEFMYKFSLKEASMIRYGKQEGVKHIVSGLNIQQWQELYNAYLKVEPDTFYKQWDQIIWKENQPQKEVLPLRIYIKNYTGRLNLSISLNKVAEYSIGQFISENFPDILQLKDNFFLIAEKFSKFKVYSHGAEINLNTPLQYLVKYFYYLDGFSYLVFDL